MTGKLRLVGVQVRPEFVIDDGETLTPVVTNQPLGQYVSAKDWPDYPTKGFLEATKALEKELAGEATRPNRAARRKANKPQARKSR